MSQSENVPNPLKAIQLRVGAISENLRLLRHVKRDGYKNRYSSELNEARYQGWADDDPTKDLVHTKPVLLDRRLRIVSGQSMYDYVVNALGRRIESNLRSINEVLEVGAGSGRVCLRLARKFPSVNFVAVEPTASGCSAIQRGADTWALKNVRIFHSGAENLDSTGLSDFDFIYSELAFEQIGSVATAMQALRCVMKLGRKGAGFYFREPWRDFNGPLQRVYLDAVNYLPLRTSDLASIRPMKLSASLCSFQHNLHFRVAIAEGELI